MHSQLISGFPIQTFGLCVATGIFLAWMTVEKLYKRPELSNLVFALIITGLIGARLTHVIQYWHEDGFDRDFAAAFQIWNGGLVFYGGLIGGALAFAVWCAVKRPDVLHLADVLCVGIPLGHAFGRIGCFFHGCCWGKVSESALAVTFPANSPVWAAHRSGEFASRSLPVLPTQLFEAAALLLLFAALLLLYRKFKGFTAGAYMIGYSVIRFFMEFLRDDPRPEMCGLSSAQNVSILLFVLGLGFIGWSLFRNAKSSSDNR